MEHELFVKMPENYDRNKTPSSPTGYNAFQKAWCQEAGRQMSASLETGSNDATISYKTRDQLQQYYSYLKEVQAVATETALAEKAGRHVLNRALFEARLRQAEPVVRQAAPLQYASNRPANIPLGHPIQMPNTQVYAHNITLTTNHSADNMVPYRLTHRPLVQQGPDSADWQRYCSVCGY
jgi:hypothetical protein